MKEVKDISVARIVLKNIVYYLKSNLLLSIGIAISTMIIAGSLIVGDSVKFSLEKIVHYRLGNVSKVLTTGDRLFTINLGKKMTSVSGIASSSALKVEGVAIIEGGEKRINNVQVFGIDSDFAEVTGSGIFDSIGNYEAIISENLARSMNLKKGDFFLLQVKKASVIPLNTPFMSDESSSVTHRIKVREIAMRENFGQFNLQASQVPPLNIFVNIHWLNKISESGSSANLIFFPENEKELNSILSESWSSEDLNLNIVQNSDSSGWTISSDRVFIDKDLSNTILNVMPVKSSVLTYFVNSFTSGSGKETPYSFISATDNFHIDNKSVIINEWLADDLSVKEGDSLLIKYYVVGPLKELAEKKEKFVVRHILPIETFTDSSLKLHLPGLTDAGNCRDWQTDIPVDLSKIRRKDEDYWNSFKGAPKAFVSLTKGREMWENRFGNLTSIQMDTFKNEKQVSEILKKHIQISDYGFEIKDVKNEGLTAARNGTDFGQLFMGLSFFILASGILLTSLFLVFNMERRSAQINTLIALGYPSHIILKIFLFEGFLLSFFGSLLGILLSVIYNNLVFIGLNQVWYDVVRTEVLDTVIKPVTLFIGFFISLFIANLTIFITLRRFLHKKRIIIRKTFSSARLKYLKIEKSAGIFLFITGILIIVFQLFNNQTEDAGLYFLSGTFLLVSILTGSHILLISIQQNSINRISYFSLGLKNITRNRTRSLTIIFLLALGTFVVVSTGSFRKDSHTGENLITGGTGGFSYFAESTIPIFRDLNDMETRTNFGLNETVKIIQFKSHEGDDASCLNLNRVMNPRILGVKTGDMSGRFSFVSKGKEFVDWNSLNKKDGNTIPAVADASVIKWGLGKKIGDTLVYLNGSGDTIQLKLMAGLSNSVFQGNILISDTFFIENFPLSSGSEVFLISENNRDTIGLVNEFNSSMRDYGWEMESTTARLNRFNSIENTYLKIFMVLGSLGLLLGTFGLIIILARSIYERKNEIGLLKATGFSDKNILTIFITEYGILIFFGIVTGLVSAAVSVFPSLISQAGSELKYVIIFALVIFLNGMIWISLISLFQINKIKITDALRDN